MANITDDQRSHASAVFRVQLCELIFSASHRVDVVQKWRLTDGENTVFAETPHLLVFIDIVRRMIESGYIINKPVIIELGTEEETRRSEEFSFVERQ